MNPFLRFLIIVAALGLAGLYLWSNPPAGMDLPQDDLPRAIGLGLVLAFILTGLSGSVRLGQAATAILGWGAILVVLVGAYVSRDELTVLAGRVLGGIVPGIAVTRSGDDGSVESVSFTRAGGGHFAVRASVDGKPVLFMLDTGASFVTLTNEVAAGLGIDTGRLRYSTPMQTANGPMRAASVTIDTLTVGPIERHRMAALVAPPGALDVSLLGMNFLNTLRGYAISGDRLTLTP
ncbi:MAG TPA: TIGR02281 family clan AA aspartic protease [Bauldia sp.]|nr:TIGR02281 family clan AA aspartic protease [Bauldia sp.]